MSLISRFLRRGMGYFLIHAFRVSASMHADTDLPIVDECEMEKGNAFYR